MDTYERNEKKLAEIAGKFDDAVDEYFSVYKEFLISENKLSRNDKEAMKNLDYFLSTVLHKNITDFRERLFKMNYDAYATEMNNVKKAISEFKATGSGKNKKISPKYY